MAERSNYCDDQDLRSLPRICERKIKSLAIPYEPLIQVQRTQSAFHPRAQRNAFRRRYARLQSRFIAPEMALLDPASASKRDLRDPERGTEHSDRGGAINSDCPSLHS